MKTVLYFRLFLLASGAAFVLVFGSNAQADIRRSRPIYAQVILAPFEIKSVPFEGASKRKEEIQVLQQLSVEATAQAKRTLLHHKIAGTVAEQTGMLAAEGAVSVTGVIQLPTSLPFGVIGLNAASRKGIFATGIVTVRDAGGKVLDEQTVELQWDDAPWITGARYRQNQRLDKVLAHFVRKTADNAVRKLSRRRVEPR
jgi:phosphoribosylcarboxyaminoimidazole (NCAIR) mutase